MQLQQMGLRPPAILGLMIVAGVAIAAAAAVSRHSGAISGPEMVTRPVLIYVGAEDCAPCRTWHRDRWAKFRASSEFERLEYRAVESPRLFEVLNDAHWPEDLRPYRKEIDSGSGVPTWLVVMRAGVILKASGLSKWDEAVFPAIQRLVR